MKLIAEWEMKQRTEMEFTAKNEWAANLPKIEAAINEGAWLKDNKSN